MELFSRVLLFPRCKRKKNIIVFSKDAFSVTTIFSSRLSKKKKKETKKNLNFLRESVNWNNVQPGVENTNLYEISIFSNK